jgi:hypothetical protein
MTAKYTRELAMDVFNCFWTDHIPSLQPTAARDRKRSSPHEYP